MSIHTFSFLSDEMKVDISKTANRKLSKSNTKKVSFYVNSRFSEGTQCRLMFSTRTQLKSEKECDISETESGIFMSCPCYCAAPAHPLSALTLIG